MVLVEVEIGGVDVGVDVIAHHIPPLLAAVPRVIVVQVLNLLQS